MRILFLFLLILSCFGISAQGLFESYTQEKERSLLSLKGHIGSTNYIGKGDRSNIHFPSSISDISLKLKLGDAYRFTAFTDLRYRYGKEFDSRISDFYLREAWVGIYSSFSGLEAGKKIVKWGRTDIFNPLEVISPKNDIIRSPDNEDRDLATMIISAFIRPSDHITFSALIVPLYQASVLPVKVMGLPDYVEFISYTDNDTLSTGIGYGIRNDYQFKSLDASIYWFDGYNKLPGIKMGMLRVPDGINTPPAISLVEHPYRMRMLGVDFEGVAGGFGYRGALTWTNPYSGSQQEEHLPFPEINWALALDYSPGDLIITLEYGGKSIIDWSKADTGPDFPDQDYLNQLFLLPPEEAASYIDQQINSFNRLINYQIEKQYHMIGINIRTSGERGRFQPDLTAIYNITTSEYLLRPMIIFKPFDSVTAKLGLEYWYGKDGSLYNYLIKPLNSIYLGIRVDF